MNLDVGIALKEFTWRHPKFHWRKKLIDDMNPPSFAILSRFLPPSSYGPSRVLSRIIDGIPSQRYGLMAIPHIDPALETLAGPKERASGRYHTVARGYIPRLIGGGKEFGIPGLKHLASAALTRATHRRSRDIARLLTDHDYRALIVCSGDPVDLPAAVRASQIAGVPCIAYLFDDFVEQWNTLPTYRAFASRIESKCLQAMSGIIVPNEKLAAIYRQRLGIQPTIIPNPYSPSVVTDSTASESDNHQPRRIVFTGTVYEANHQPLRDLVTVLSKTNEEWQLHLCSATPEADIRAAGVDGPRVVFHGHLSEIEVARIQTTADALFLPLGSETPYPALISTSLPGKMAEYMVSGCPILAYVPTESFVARYLRKHDAAFLVDATDPDKLCLTLDQIVADPSLGQAVSKAAERQARSDFNPTAAQSAFLALIDSVCQERAKR